ncbi:MAG TPA: RibD family protein [Alphaproteobacteria bacterium]|jgi:riboflavin-specific deaminase-like protein
MSLSDSDSTVSEMPDDVWSAILSVVQAGGGDLPAGMAEPWRTLFAPLCRPRFVVGQLGQSLDGRIATASGHSHYINGREAIVHLHRLRALADAVVVGVGTAVADDPQLTVRHVEGDHPARVVIDPKLRLLPDAKLLTRDGVRRCIVTMAGCETRFDADIDIVPIRPGTDGNLPPTAIIAALNDLGFRRILVEGGTSTLSAFLAAGCLDRLHLAVAPLIIGAGPFGLSLPPIDKLDAALRPPAQVYRLGADVLFDCDLSR